MPKFKAKNRKLKIFYAAIGASIFISFLLPFHSARAATNVTSTPAFHWSWNDVISWTDWYNTNSIVVSAHKLTGYASSSVGFIVLDCATSASLGGSGCGGGNWGVSNDGGGGLSGWGWNDVIGWIGFCGTSGSGTPDCPNVAYPYQVQINPNTGDFSNWAWNDLVGWISLNCSNHGCGVTYKVNTDWRATSASGTLDSSTFDTGVASGTQINSIIWQGYLPPPAGEAKVLFQLAVSNSPAGPWNFMGPDGTENTFYSDSPNTSIPLDYNLFNNKRYFRYRVTFLSNVAQSASPRVDEIIVHVSQ